MKTILHRDGTVTYWSVYQQAWQRRATTIWDRELAAMTGAERERVRRHIGAGADVRTCQNVIDDSMVCGRPLTRVGVEQYVCRSCLARVAGSATSDRKAASSAANGRKGGRPRKVKQEAI